MSISLKHLSNIEWDISGKGKTVYWRIPSSGSWRTSGNKTNGSLPRTSLDSENPIKIKNVNQGKPNHDYWYFQKMIYETNDLELTQEDVLALLSASANKRRLQLEKAHALQAMTSELDSRNVRKPVAQDVKLLVWQRDSGRCIDCGSKENLEFDHIIPVSMGGANTARNLQLLCEGCNRRKGASLG